MTSVPANKTLAEVTAGTPGKTWRAGTLVYTSAGLAALFLWLIGGDFGLALRDRGAGAVFQLLIQKYGASDTFTALMMGSVPSALALFLGPVISYKSDRHRSRWGRRIPFLFLSTPFFVIALAGMAFSPILGGSLHHMLGPRSPGANISVLFFISLFWIIFDFAGLIAGAVFGALLNDVVPQVFLGRIFGAFRGIGLAAGIIFNHWIYGVAATQYLWIFLGMAALSAIGNLILCMKAKEGEYPPPTPVNAAPGLASFIAAAKGYFQECLGHSYYWWFFIFSILCVICGNPINNFSLYYALSLKLNTQQYGDCLAITYAISFFLAYPMGALADRFHPLRMTLVSLGFYAVVALVGSLLVRDVRTFEFAFVAHGVAAGMLWTTMGSLALRLLPRESFAQFSSAGGILGSCVGIVFGPVVGAILDHLHHDYRYTFYMSFLLTIVAILCGLVLHTKFMALGGPQNYVAPQSSWGKTSRLEARHE
jgi:MFS family permease